MSETNPATKKSKIESEGQTSAVDTSNTAELSNSEKKAVVKQINYYFSDRNLPRDQFLQQKLKESKEGWIGLDVLLTFNRLKQITSDASAIAKALRDADKTIVEVSEDGTAVRRDPAKPLAEQAQLDERSIYARGFDTEKLTIEYVEKWVESLGCTPEAVLVRRVPGAKTPKGSVYVQVASVEEAEKIVATPQSYDGKDLQVEMKGAYHERKRDERRKKKATSKAEHDEQRKQEKYTEAEEMMTNNCIVKLLDLHEDCSREDLRDVFEEFGEIAWVDYSRGESDGFIRYKADGSAVKAVEAIKERDLKVQGKALNASMLEGQDEKDYWVKVNEEKKAVRKAKRDSRHRKGGHRGKGAKRGQAH